MDVSTLESALSKYFNYASFRPKQGELTSLVATGQNCMGIFNTGGGKSICFQLPALLDDGLTLVISPLISLIKDQVYALKEKRLPADAITQDTPYPVRSKIIASAKSGRIKLLYVSPEMASNPDFIGQFGPSTPISRVVFDEAHCLSQWGHDFRPAYLNVVTVLKRIDGIYAKSSVKPIQRVAVTATAKGDVERHIASLLEVTPKNVIRTSLLRNNIQFRVINVKDKAHRKQTMLNIIKHHQGAPVVVYANSRFAVDDIFNVLRLSGISAVKYRGGMLPKERDKAQSAFLSNDVQVIVATTAFGMGVDKPDIRAIINFSAPRTLDDYSQMAGRAGRDGLKSYSYMLFNADAEYRTLLEMINDSHPNSSDVEQLYKTLYAYQQSIGEMPVQLEADSLSVMLKQSRSKVSWGIQFLTRHKVLVPENNGKAYFVQNLDSANFSVIDKLAAYQTTNALEVINYGRTNNCRQRFMLGYFGEHLHADCGICDNCLQVSSAERQGDQSKVSASKAILRAQLIGAREEIAALKRIPPFSVLSAKAMNTILENPPTTRDQLRELSGMKKIDFELNGQPLLQAISRYGAVIGNQAMMEIQASDKASEQDIAPAVPAAQ